MEIFKIPTIKTMLNKETIESTDFTTCMSGSQVVCQDNEKRVFTNYYYVDSQETALTAVSPKLMSEMIIPNYFRKDIAVRVQLDEIGYKYITEMMFRIDDETLMVGEFPQTAAPLEVAKRLEVYYSIHHLATTGKKYILEFDKGKDGTLKFNATDEYFYNGKKYIRVEAQNASKSPIELSTGQRVNKHDPVWIEVEPVYFKKIDDEWISEKLLFSGIAPFFASSKMSGFNESNINKFLNTCFVENMIPSTLLLLKKAEKEELSENEILTIISYLQNVPENSLQYARSQVSKFGEEYLEFFDSLWINGDLYRAKTISNLKTKKAINF